MTEEDTEDYFASFGLPLWVGAMWIDTWPISNKFRRYLYAINQPNQQALVEFYESCCDEESDDMSLD